MSRLLPQPVVSLALLVVWLLAWDSVAPGLVLLGLVVAVGVPRLTGRFWPEAPRRVRARPLLRFLPLFAWDVLVANVVVAALVLGPRSRLRPGFMVVPLDTRDPWVTTLLASVITLTPGTVSANLSGDGRALLVHALDLPDPAAAVAQIKARYERALMEIFPC
jgi:multicomponent K+:H+ antiporter subunit E